MAILDALINPLAKAVGFLLAFFFGLPPHNLGVAIILVTFTVMGLLYPLTAKQARSMIAMQMVQPEIKRIQAKYKNDRAKLNEEMMAFYQENKINPLAGCLPLLVQMPIFFALFRMLQKPYEYVPTSSKLYEALCTNPKTGRLFANPDACGAQANLPVPQKFLGLNLSLEAAAQVTTWAKFFGFALVVLVMFTGYMQSRQAQKRTPAINKQMALITKVLPVFFGFISLNFPAGLVLYFFVSNLWRLGQQEVIFRRFGTAAAPKHKSLVNPPKAKAVDAESRERDGTVVVDDPVEDDRSPKALPAKGAGAKASGSAKAGSGGKGANGAATSGKQLIGPSTGGGGLRGLFKPPPPPSGSPTPRPAAKPAPKPAPKRSTSSSTGTTARPGEAGRPTGKKKKKR